MTLTAFSRRVRALGQFHVDDPLNPRLSDTDEHHLRKVLRAKVGEEIVVTNGAGAWTFAEVETGGLRRVFDLCVDRAKPETTLYLAPLKGDRSEWAVAKATELGITRIVPLLSERVVVKFKGEAKEKTLRRWQRIALESAGQCRRTYDLVIEPPLRVADVPLNVAVADVEVTGTWDGLTAVAIGPEGGWAPHEWESSRRFVGLGQTVLRSETAALAVATLLAQAQHEGAVTPRMNELGNDEGIA
jgi:16S rRNA (uracil1498-N3)-methyltransferase